VVDTLIHYLHPRRFLLVFDNCEHLLLASADDAVAAEVQFTGTNTGPMMMAGKEIPPTGKPVVGKGTYFARVRNGSPSPGLRWRMA